jgi:peroxiredoxin
MRIAHWMTSLLAVLTIGVVAHTFAAEQGSAPAKVGAQAPTFSLTDQNGKDVSLKDFAGKVVVLEWTNPKCPIVQRHYKEKTMVTLNSQYKAHDVAWLAINSSSYATNEADAKWAGDQAINYPVLNDASGAVGKAYGATNTPEMYIIGKDGTLLYKGAIDNDPQGEMSNDRVNYVRQALDEVLAGKPVTTAETKAYGCSVKYKD